MITEQLKNILRKIRDDNYNIPEGESISLITQTMLEHIGDTDPELRDELIYSIFCEWICEKEYYNEEELQSMLMVLLDKDHLFYGIGSEGDNTVFTRTFSVLSVVLVLIQHRKKPFLDLKMFSDVKQKLISYYSQEKDLRGYLGDFGWAHGAAHGADAMDELVQCRECDESVCFEILEAIKKVLWNGRYFFSNEEDERVARVVYRMVKNNSLPFGQIDSWIMGLAECCNWDKTRAQYISRVNSKNLVRCLYLIMKYNECMADMACCLLETEKRLNRFFQIEKNI